jgi:predicted phage terminase large subunit-like protein
MNNDILLSALMRKARRQRAKEDILYFAEYYLPHIVSNRTPVFHQEIMKLLSTENRLGIAAPRGFAKSTILQIIYGLYCLLFNEGEDILTISQSSQLAEDWVRKIKYEFDTNTQIKNDFGNLLQWGDKDSKRWTNSHLIIQKEGKIFSQIKARGRGCQVRGLRPTKVFADDLEDEELVRSDEQRKYLKEWFLSALLNVLKNDQQLVVIGTILHPLSLLADLIDKKEQFKDWTTKKYRALNGDESLWPDRFPVVDLLKRKEEIGTYAFEAEYQNNPISSDICLWRPEWIKKWDVLPEITKKYIALDPATSTKESADFSALTCVGQDVEGNIYEIESWKGRWGTWDLVDRCIKFYQKHKPLRFGIEEVAFQSVMKDVLIREAKKQGIYIPIEPLRLGVDKIGQKEVKESKDKYTRALSIIHFFEQGHVFLKTQYLIDQLSVFPTGGEDDLVDSMVYSLMLLNKYSPLKIYVSNPSSQPVRFFNVKDKYNTPCFAPPIGYRPSLRSWKTGT